MFSHDNEPVTCRNGHPLGPYQCLVSFARCHCDRAGPGGGHLSWRCRTCDDIQYSDGHTDDAQLVIPANPELGGHG